MKRKEKPVKEEKSAQIHSGSVFFASDFHLGIPAAKPSPEREKMIVQWLNQTAQVARAYYLLGDLFDFWFEYKKTVPKGYVRLLGKLAEISDSGTDLHIFSGNHDLWMQGYFKDELGAQVHTHPLEIDLDGKKFYLAHGDGIGPGDTGYKAMKKLFTNPVARFFFRWIHPDAGIPLARFFSARSRASGLEPADAQINPEEEAQVIHSKEMLNIKHIDYFIYGHRHIPYEYAVNENSTVLNLGDWMRHFTYAEWKNGQLKLKKFEQQ
jgi:UDP-2,3-diacylglucosamine hydrolase